MFFFLPPYKLMDCQIIGISLIFICENTQPKYLLRILSLFRMKFHLQPANILIERNRTCESGNCERHLIDSQLIRPNGRCARKWRLDRRHNRVPNANVNRHRSAIVLFSITRRCA